ncbi:MAG: 2-dehydro-3-deoxygalactonokinase [Paracoccus sp. (in: a-proteobacteria)]
MTVLPDWIAADWGTSNLRLWAMWGNDVVETRASERGMGAMSGPDDFIAELARLTDGWPPVPVIACGMVGARQGWVEAPYRSVPCTAVSPMISVPGNPGGRPVLIVGGIMQQDPPDVMRGEETQIAGLLAANPDFDGTICLPGTHTKWVRISAGEVCHFHTIMTGEVFNLLARQSVLRHSLSADVAPDPGSAVFLDAVATALSQPHLAWSRLFRLRAAGLTGQGGIDTEQVAQLSGTLIGLDLGASRAHWLGQQILILGASRLAILYDAALRQQRATPIIGDADTATRAGLHAAWCQYRNQI